MRPRPPTTGRSLAALALLLAGSASALACGTDSAGAPPPTNTTPVEAVDQAGFFEREIWQTDLKVVGCYGGEIDGRILPETEAALRAFQQATGLTADGRYGPGTDTALKRAILDRTIVCRSPATAPPTSAPPPGPPPPSPPPVRR